MTERDEQRIEELSTEAEIVIGTTYVKKDLKERRNVAKNSLYNGSNKLKHRVPKGKQV
jgi:hypothetical protein